MILSHWKQCNVDVIGVSHKKHQEPCQDRSAHLEKNGVRVIALCDGAGSKKHAELGAAAVSEMICSIVSEKFDAMFEKLEDQPTVENHVGQEIIKTIETGLQQILTKHGLKSIQDLSTTLLFFAIKDERYLSGHIGDGVIGKLHKHKDTYYTEVFSKPENGGAPNITFFITDPNAHQHLRLYSGYLSQSLKAIVLMSDGPEEVLYDAKADAFNPYLINILSIFNGKSQLGYQETLKRFLTEKVANYSYDDLSMNVLYLEREDADFYASKSNDYKEAIMKKLVSNHALIRQSAYAYHLDDSVAKGAVSDKAQKRLKEIVYGANAR